MKCFLLLNLFNKRQNFKERLINLKSPIKEPWISINNYLAFEGVMHLMYLLLKF